MKKLYLLQLSLISPVLAQASEADLKIPKAIHEFGVLHWGFFIAFLGILFGIYQFLKVRKLPAHKNMLDVAQVIYRTCSTYLKQQGKFLAKLFVFIGIAVAAYFGFLAKATSHQASTAAQELAKKSLIYMHSTSRTCTWARKQQWSSSTCTSESKQNTLAPTTA